MKELKKINLFILFFILFGFLVTFSFKIVYDIISSQEETVTPNEAANTKYIMFLIFIYLNFRY